MGKCEVLNCGTSVLSKMIAIVRDGGYCPGWWLFDLWTIKIYIIPLNSSSFVEEMK